MQQFETQNDENVTSEIIDEPKLKSRAPYIAAIVFLIISVVSAFSISFVGEFINTKTDELLGLLSYVVFALTAYLAVLTLVNKKVHTIIRRKVAGVALLVAGLIIIFGDSNFAGAFGNFVDQKITETITLPGAAFVGILLLFFGSSIILFDNWTAIIRKAWARWKARNKVNVKKVDHEVIKPVFDKKVFAADTDKISAYKGSLNEEVSSDLEFIQNKPSVNDRIIFKGNMKRSFFIDDEQSDFEDVCPQSDAFEFASDKLNEKDTRTEEEIIESSSNILEKPVVKEYNLDIRPHGFVNREDENVQSNVVAQQEVEVEVEEVEFINNQLFEETKIEEFDELPFEIENKAPEIKLELAPFEVKTEAAPIIVAEKVSYNDNTNDGEVTQNESEKPMKNVQVKKGYKKPGLELLNEPSITNGSEENVVNANAMKSILEQALSNFGVVATVDNITVGPAITRYELVPEIGTRISKVVNLQDDIKMALAAKEIRIEAPIPGKSAIGIEVPNKVPTMVSFKEVLEKAPKDKADSKMLVALGKDVSGAPVFAELNKMPHMLVAGATGSGKSVCINTILTSIIMRAKPDEVRLLLIDPKMVELSGYDGIAHLLCPVVTDPKRASVALRNLVNEMERRYSAFKDTYTKNIEGYNEEAEKNGVEKMPYILAIIDELADLMIVAAKDVEESIMRITQKARAAGIHLIVATQRPSVDVITGVIKANIPSRIAFAVSSQVDSRTILDAVGAEMLLGKGDALFAPIGQSSPTRIQGAFISENEVKNVVYHVKMEMNAQYADEMINLKVSSGNSNSNSEENDEIFPEVVDFVISEGRASTSLIQRRFGIGYNRAARMIDVMEAEGIIGPAQGSKPREVLK